MLDYLKQLVLERQRRDQVQELTEQDVDQFDDWVISGLEVDIYLQKLQDWWWPDVNGDKFSLSLFWSFDYLKDLITERFPHYFDSNKYHLTIIESEFDPNVIEVTMEWNRPDCPLLESTDPLVIKIREAWTESVYDDKHSINDLSSKIDSRELEDILKKLLPEYRDTSRWGIVCWNDHYDGSLWFYEHRLSEDVPSEMWLI
jgi:hypothetical protein